MLHLLSRNWWAVLLRGICAVLFGLVAFTWPGITLAVLILFFGAYVLVDGVFAVVSSFGKKEGGKFPWSMFVVGLISIVAGVITLVLPGLTALVLLYLIAAWAIVRGIFEVVAAVELRKQIEGEWFLVFAGLASVVFGVLMMFWPGAGALALLWLIGIFAIIFGVVMIILAFKLRGLKKRVEHVAA
jgi:uncharacterized membrane protein HdeD (DUF308 family)